VKLILVQIVYCYSLHKAIMCRNQIAHQSTTIKLFYSPTSRDGHFWTSIKLCLRE